MKSNAKAYLRSGLAVWKGMEMHPEGTPTAQDIVRSSNTYSRKPAPASMLYFCQADFQVDAT